MDSRQFLSSDTHAALHFFPCSVDVDKEIRRGYRLTILNRIFKEIIQGYITRTFCSNEHHPSTITISFQPSTWNKVEISKGKEFTECGKS